MSEQTPKLAQKVFIRLKNGSDWEMELIDGQEIATKYIKGIDMPQVSKRLNDKQTFIQKIEPGQTKLVILTYDHSDNSVRPATPEEITNLRQQTYAIEIQAIYQGEGPDPDRPLAWEDSNYSGPKDFDPSDVQNQTGND